MNKLLTFIFLSLFVTSTSSGKISNQYYEVLVDGCMEAALKTNNNYKLVKKYCTCAADHMDNNYNDESLIQLVQMEGGSVYRDIVDYVRRLCKEKVGYN